MVSTNSNVTLLHASQPILEGTNFSSPFPNMHMLFLSSLLHLQGKVTCPVKEFYILNNFSKLFGMTLYSYIKNMSTNYL